MLTGNRPINDEWRVGVLDNTTAGTGLVSGYVCLFSMPEYWPYGNFEPQAKCELPGNLFRAKASGQAGAQHVYLTPGSFGERTSYSIQPGRRLYIAWQFKHPSVQVSGGKFSYVCLDDGPWQIWFGADDAHELVCYLNLRRGGEWTGHKLSTVTNDDGKWIDVQLILDHQVLQIQINQTDCGSFEHDTYPQRFEIRLGSFQTLPDGPEVVTEYRYVYVNTIPYPYSFDGVAEGPEDIRDQDDALCYLVCPASSEIGRRTSADLIKLKDKSLLLLWGDHIGPDAKDSHPTQIMAKRSTDSGKTWGKPWILVQADPDPLKRAHSPSLLRAHDGDLLLAYNVMPVDRRIRGMVIRRSSDEGSTWSSPRLITPDTGNVIAANNASLRMLSTGRIVLAVREYIPIPKDTLAPGHHKKVMACPRCLYSDDDGRTWKAGQHVPDPDLTDGQRAEQNVNEPSIAELADGRLLMTMRTIAGGQFFAYSSDGGQSWCKPYLSPLRGVCAPCNIQRIPGTDDILAVWCYGLTARTPLVSAISSDGGRSWKHLKLLEQSQYHTYGYTSVSFIEDRVFLTTMHIPGYITLTKLEAEAPPTSLRLISLPLEWFYREISK